MSGIFSESTFIDSTADMGRVTVMKKFSTALLASLFLVLPGAAFAQTYGGYYGNSGYPQPVYYNQYSRMPIYGCYGQFQYTPCTTSYQQPSYTYQQPSYNPMPMYQYPQMYPQQRFNQNPYMFNSNTNMNTNTNTNTITIANNSNAYAYAYMPMPMYGYVW